jgi:dTDP-4-dehydrorhamnose reductase
MKILITGSNGLLGQKIVYACLGKYKSQVELIATARGNNRLIEQTGYTYHAMDISNQANVLEVIEQFMPDVVIQDRKSTRLNSSHISLID